MTSLFSHIPAELSDEERLVAAYVACGRTLDDLPYTPEFEKLYAQAGAGRTRRDIFHRLQNLRKAGRLPKMGRAAASPIRVTPDEEAAIVRLVEERVGSLGQRDQLPFDPRIDDLAEAFNHASGRQLSQHDVWRLIAKLAK